MAVQEYDDLHNAWQLASSGLRWLWLLLWDRWFGHASGWARQVRSAHFSITQSSKLKGRDCRICHINPLCVPDAVKSTTGATQTLCSMKTAGPFSTTRIPRSTTTSATRKPRPWPAQVRMLSLAASTARGSHKSSLCVCSGTCKA